MIIKLSLLCSVQFSSVIQSCPTLCDPMNHSTPVLPPSITNSWSLLKLMSIKSVMPSGHFILCRPLLFLPSIPPSIRVFSNESTLHMRWPKYWSLSFSISPSNEHPGLISFRMDWLGLLAVQGTLKSLLQHRSSKTSTFRRSAFFCYPFTILFILSDHLSTLLVVHLNTSVTQTFFPGKYVPLFILLVGFLRQEYWSCLPFPPVVD